MSHSIGNAKNILSKQVVTSFVVFQDYNIVKNATFDIVTGEYFVRHDGNNSLHTRIV